MQEFLPVVKATLLEWAQLALGNPLFTAALILATALLASIIGMIRVVPTKKRAAASERARAELANQLSMVQQQAAGLQERLMQRNQQISATVQALAAGFDVGEQPLPAVSEDLASEDLWGQHDRVVTQLANRLRSEQQAKADLQLSYQAERDKCLEKKAVIDSLQNTLAEKTLHVTGLEQQAAQILEKHTVQSARLAELEQQRLEWDVRKDQQERLEEKLAATEAELSRLQKEVEARHEAESVPAPIHPEPVAEVEPVRTEIHPEPAQAAAPIESAIPQPPVEEAAFIPPPQPAAAGPAGMPSSPPIAESAGTQPQSIVLPDWDYQPEIAVPSGAEAQTASGKEGGAGFAGKLKGLFGKPKSEAPASVEKPGKTGSAEAEIPLETRPEPRPQSSAGFAQGQSRLRKVTTLFGRSGEATAEEEVQASEPPQSVDQPEVPGEIERGAASARGQLGKIKSLLGLSNQKAAEAEAELGESRTDEYAAAEPADAAEPSGSSAKGQFGKIKNLFGMAKG